jgi:hypothetical protein
MQHRAKIMKRIVTWIWSLAMIEEESSVKPKPSRYTGAT